MRAELANLNHCAVPVQPSTCVGAKLLLLVLDKDLQVTTVISNSGN